MAKFMIVPTSDGYNVYEFTFSGILQSIKSNIKKTPEIARMRYSKHPQITTTTTL